MIAPRRFLPSISSLRAFEAVARLGTATQAAQELLLTQSAISRQLKTLETQLGITLFTRKGRQLILTETGQRYITDVREVLTKLAQASVAACTNPNGGVLNLSILPAFGMHWLAPRLRDFAQTHPEVTVNLSTRLRPFDLARSGFDAAIHFGREDWPDVNYLRLLPETVVPVCAPDLIASWSQGSGAIVKLPLLHLETRPKAWARWLAAFGDAEEPQTGMVFDQFATMAQAAVHGMGVALLPTFLADPYLQSGQLVLASEHTAQSIGSYYLVWPKQDQDTATLRSFVNWLEIQIADH